MAAGQATTTSGGGVPPIRRPQTIPGPAWSGSIGPDTPWGAWLDVPQGGLVAVDVRWGDVGAGPTLRLATPEGEWWTPATQPGPPCYRAWIEVPPGWTWISLEEHYAEDLMIDVATHLPIGPPPNG
jgi:hypothetical protein